VLVSLIVISIPTLIRAGSPVFYDVGPGKSESNRKNTNDCNDTNIFLLPPFKEEYSLLNKLNNPLSKDPYDAERLIFLLYALAFQGDHYTPLLASMMPTKKIYITSSVLEEIKNSMNILERISLSLEKKLPSITEKHSIEITEKFLDYFRNYHNSIKNISLFYESNQEMISSSRETLHSKNLRDSIIALHYLHKENGKSCSEIDFNLFSSFLSLAKKSKKQTSLLTFDGAIGGLMQDFICVTSSPHSFKEGPFKKERFYFPYLLELSIDFLGEKPFSPIYVASITN
jgi:hypothetical protein